MSCQYCTYGGCLSFGLTSGMIRTRVSSILSKPLVSKMMGCVLDRDVSHASKRVMTEARTRGARPPIAITIEVLPVRTLARLYATRGVIQISSWMP